MTGFALECVSLTRRYGGFTALNSVSIELVPGEIHGLIGPNGAGKSTLFRLLGGFVRPATGEVNVLGHALHGTPDPADLRRLRASVGQILQGCTWWGV